MYENIIRPLHNVQDFIHWHDKFQPIFGYLAPLEGYALKLLAANDTPQGEIVEIGSFMGRSTCWLAAGVMDKKGVKVNAVDHFKGSPEHQAGQFAECRELIEKGSTLENFKANIKAAALEPYINPMVGTSEEMVRGWTKPIRLLFIDGDHSYEASKRDFELWSPYVCNGGVIALHDISVFIGVTRFYRELMAGDHPYREIMKVKSLAIINKIGG
jgi:predicted O-methyltransferase YrrM